MQVSDHGGAWRSLRIFRRRRDAERTLERQRAEVARWHDARTGRPVDVAYRLAFLRCEVIRTVPGGES